MSMIIQILAFWLIPKQKVRLDRELRPSSVAIVDILLFPLDQTKFEEMKEDLKQQFDLEYVIVNGRVVINRGQHTGNLPGRILKKQIKA